MRETSLYATSLGLFGVLTGLALITPLNAFADDVLRDPFGGNWSGRFLAVGLLATTGFWLHVLTANMGVKTLAASSAGRHPSLPGVRWFSGYHTAISDMWTGAIQVVLLIILSAAIPRGVAVFLGVYIIFLASNALDVVIYMVRNRTWARLAWRSGLHPLALIRQMESDRFVPAYPDDIDSISRGDNPEAELMYVRAVSFVFWESAIVAVWSAGLWVVASNSPALAAAISLLWFVSVVARMVLDYRLFPQAFAA